MTAPTMSTQEIRQRKEALKNEKYVLETNIARMKENLEHIADTLEDSKRRTYAQQKIEGWQRDLKKVQDEIAHYNKIRTRAI